MTPYTYQLTTSTTILRSDGALIPADHTNADYQQYLAWQAVGNTPIPAPAPTQAQTLASFEVATQTYIDSIAIAWGYDSLLAAASYATSTVLKYKNEALALLPWRDSVWAACYTAQTAIQAGTQPMPASPTAFIASLPVPPVRPV